METAGIPRVLMVCTGNICRSVMAQVMLAQDARKAGVQVQVDSCAITSGEVGNPMDQRAEQVLREAEYSIPGHRARQIRPSDLENFDLILAMTTGHYRAIEKMIQRQGVENFRGRLRMFRDFEPAHEHDTLAKLEQKFSEADSSRDVDDPWYGNMEDFYDVRETISRCNQTILRALPQ